MFGIFLIALIIYAVVQHRKRKRIRWLKYGGGDWSKYDWSKHDWSKYGDPSKWSRDWSKWKADAKATTTASAERFANDLHAKIKNDFDTKMARKFEAKAERFERKLKQRFDKQTQKYSGVSADPAMDLPPPPQFKNDAERKIYERARKRAQAEAGFFIHLMWYGIIIGFLFLINMFTSPFIWWWHVAGVRMGLWNREPLRGGVRMAMGPSARLRARDRARSSARSFPGEGGAGDREAGVARRADRHLRARNSQSDRGGQEPGAADGRGSHFARKRRIREGRARRAGTGRAQRVASAQIREGRRLQLRQLEPGLGPRRRADPDAQQARSELGDGLARIHERSDGARRCRQAAPGFHQHHRQRDRRDGIEHRRPSARHHHTQQRSRHGDGDDSRQRMRNRGRQDREDFQSVLYHQRPRHRPWPGRREEGDRFASRQDRSAQQRRAGHRVRAGDSAERRGPRQRRRRAVVDRRSVRSNAAQKRAAELSPQNNSDGANTTPIVPLAAGAPPPDHEGTTIERAIADS